MLPMFRFFLVCAGRCYDNTQNMTCPLTYFSKSTPTLPLKHYITHVADKALLPNTYTQSNK